jgi:hypothetical protein
MFPYAAIAEEKTGVSRELILTQWGLETGWGSSQAFKKGLNLAGIKNTTSWTGGSVGSYRAYTSLEESVQDYARVMGLDYYTQVRAAGNPYSQAAALDESPWAEDPNYGVKLRSILPKVSAILNRSLAGGWSDAGISNNSPNVPYFKGVTSGIKPIFNVPEKISEGVEETQEKIEELKQGVVTPIFKFIAYLFLFILLIIGGSMLLQVNVKELNPVGR